MEKGKNGFETLVGSAKKVFDETQTTESFEELRETFNRVTTAEDGSDKVLNFMDSVSEKMEDFFEKIDRWIG